MTRVVLRGALLVPLLALTACSGGAGAHAATPRPASTHPVAAAPSTTPLPTPTSQVAREAVNPDPHFDYGFVVQITPQGYHPQWLVANCCAPITWRNLTGKTTSVVFDVQGINSGPIPPGGSWVFTPRNVESLVYHSGFDPSVSGNVQVNQTVDG